MDSGEKEATDAQVSVLDVLDETTYSSLCELIPQLSRSAVTPTFEQIRAVIEAPSNSVLVARVAGRIVGMLTVVVVPIPTGRVAHIEDVVVSEDARGHGVGRTLALAAVKVARSAGVKQVDLTSRPSRKAANGLYQSLGFVPRETNIYRFSLGH